MGSLEQRLAEALDAPVLAERLRTLGEPLWRRRGADAAAARLDGPMLRGLARALATRPEIGGFLSHRPALFERICGAGADCLATRSLELAAAAAGAPHEDLEAALDALRILRREETCLAACADLGGLVAFPAVSEFLSLLAEAIARRALHLAERRLEHAALCAVGMGKIAGREFTYHSDLDLIFLFEGGPERIGDASRVGQRMISYLTTMTGAGVAYEVDTRLRPSGQQGMLVTRLARFESYQSDEAETWEHVAVLRARAIAGDVEPAQQVLDRVHARLLSRGLRPWSYLAPLRTRVESERASRTDRGVAFKTGPGGLMDVDFLAAGALLERGAERFPALPSVPAMLRAAVRGPRVEQLVDDYARLRLLEARARWLAGRSIEALGDAQQLAPLAALLEPPLCPEALLESIAAVRARIRGAWSEVVEAGTASVLGSADGARAADPPGAPLTSP